MASNIDIAIKARNEASGAIRQVSADLQGLDAAAEGVGGGLGNLGGLLAGGLIAGGLTMIADQAIGAAGAIYDLAKSATSFDALKDSFRDLAGAAGESGDAMLGALRTASQGMIADQDLILSANRAMMLGVAQNAQQMTQLLQVATVRGKAMGMSATDAFNDLVTGLGRMSPLILDNLGIVTGGEKVFDDYAKSLNRTAASLSDAERKQALLNKVISESRGMLAGGGVKANPFAQLDASLTNFKITAGTIAAPLAAEIAAGAAQGVANLSRILNDSLSQEDLSGAGKFGYAMGVSIKEAVIAGLGAGGPIEFRTLFGSDFNQSAYDAAQGFKRALAEGMPEITQAAGAALGDSSALTDQTAQMQRLFELEQQIRTELDAMMADTRMLTKLMETGNQDLMQPVFDTRSGHIEELKRVREEYARLMETMQRVPGPVMAVSDSLWDGITGWRDMTRAAKDAVSATSSAASASASAASGLGSAATAGFNFSYALNAITGSAGAVPGAIGAAASAIGSIRAMMVDATLAGLAMADALAVVQRYSGLEKSAQTIAQGLGNLNLGYTDQQIAYYVDLNTQDALKQVKDLAAEAGKVPEALKGPGAKTPDYGLDEVGRQVGRVSGLQAEYQRAVADTNEETRAGAREAVKFGDTVAGSTAYAKRGTDELRAGFGQLGDGIQDALGGAGGGGAAGAIDGLSTSLDDLKGKVQGVLSGALNTGVGVSASDLLPREDDINENARRLADIAVNGFKGQDWLGEFQAEAPQAYQDIMDQVAAGVDAKSAAARILRDFEDGMRPDLIDKGLVKERVKRMIVGDQNMAALAEEIAQELATEMGIPLQQAMAAAGASMGVTTGAAGEAAAAAASGAGATDMTGGGMTAGQTWIAGFMAQADGTQIVAGIVAKLQTEMPKFLDAGKGAGTQWGAGFMSTVESGIANPLINLLVTLVTPGVMAQQAAGKSQSEAPQ